MNIIDNVSRVNKHAHMNIVKRFPAEVLGEERA